MNIKPSPPLRDVLGSLLGGKGSGISYSNHLHLWLDFTDKSIKAQSGKLSYLGHISDGAEHSFWELDPETHILSQPHEDVTWKGRQSSRLVSKTLGNAGNSLENIMLHARIFRLGQESCFLT